MQNPGYTFDELIFRTTMRFHWTLFLLISLDKKLNAAMTVHLFGYNRMLIDFLWICGNEMERERLQNDGDDGK